MLAVTPDPNGDSNSNGRSDNKHHDHPWPFERRLGDMKAGSVLVSRLLVAVSLRQGAVVGHFRSCIRYSLHL